MKKALLTIAIIFTAVLSINAQTTTASVSQTVTLILKNSININLVAATGNSFTFDDTNDFANGVTNTNASTFQVKSNLPWAVSVKTSTTSFSGSATTIMPASTVAVRLNGGTTFSPLSTNAASLTSGGRGIASFGVDYKAAPGYVYDAGTYSITVVYTATQQ